ncbi:MAG: fumarylacetoacetate hydrolase family protein [Bacteroidales bacterium]|nr:fumarylacetoacetate hydrolase family protein [Bacteroidales bacterium]
MKIICIGRNYSAHALELKHSIPSEPIFFLKPDTALAQSDEPFYLPDFSQQIEYECELVVKINKVGKSIEKNFAHNYYNEVALGLDITARDIQQNEISNGLPWSLSKTFDYSAPLSAFVSLSELGKDVQNIDFNLLKNGVIVQQANTGNMLFGVDELIAYLSRFITLKVGDLIFTGTPSGVGKMEAGDYLECYLEGRKMLNIAVK